MAVSGEGVDLPLVRGGGEVSASGPGGGAVEVCLPRVLEGVCLGGCLPLVPGGCLPLVPGVPGGVSASGPWGGVSASGQNDRQV